MPDNYLPLTLLSFLAGIFLLFLGRRYSLRKGFLVKNGIPLTGGISIALSFSIGCLYALYAYSGFSVRGITGIVMASSLMLLFGIIDDLRDLSISYKFLVQIIATYLLILFGIRTRIGFIGNFSNLILTYIWVIGITNAFNHLDIMDGLAGGIALIVGLSFLAIALFNRDISTIILSIALCAAILSFLLYNFPPAKIYMGNSGSHFLGFVLAAIAITISYAPTIERKTALISPLLIMGFPIFDTAFLIFIRLNKNKVPFKKSNDHLALRFLVLGYSKRKSLFVMLALCALFCICGILLVRLPNIINAVIIVSVFVGIFLLAKRMSRIKIDA